ncbi:MAG: sodium:calcium antiporter, partial [Clostridiales bacterium]|nr:sodium:calcium antiporter [Clostridiales bacterium]
GLLIIIKGGDIFVGAAVAVAQATGIPKMLIGATIVSMATALPELFISSLAAAQGAPELSLGNNIGSVILNTGVILGFSLLARRQAVGRDFQSKGLFMLFSLLVLIGASLDRVIGYLDAAILLILFLYYIISSAREALTVRLPEDAAPRRPINKGQTVLRLLMGAACIVIGAQLMVKHGVALAAALGVPQRIIGLTVVAVGSSLPELVTTVTAMLKKEFSMGVGNIIGANTLNIVLIPPVCALLSRGNLPLSGQAVSFLPGEIPTALYIDMPVALLLMAVALLPGMLKRRLYPWQGFLSIGLYLAYLCFIFTTMR